MIMDLTVRQSVDIEKFTICKRTMAIRADKTVWMPLNVKSCDIISCYGKIAAGALVGEQVEKVCLAVWFTIFLVKAVVGVKLATTMSTNKMFGMKCLIQCNGDFLQGRCES